MTATRSCRPRNAIAPSTETAGRVPSASTSTSYERRAPPCVSTLVEVRLDQIERVTRQPDAVFSGDGGELDAVGGRPQKGRAGGRASGT